MMEEGLRHMTHICCWTLNEKGPYKGTVEVPPKPKRSDYG